MRLAFSDFVDSTKYAVTIGAFFLIERVFPDIEHPLLSSILDVLIALVCGLVILLLFNLVLGLPRISMTWIIGREPASSNRPDLIHDKNGLFFRYEVRAESWLARRLLLASKRAPLEAHFQMSPTENLRFVKQRCGKETVYKSGTMVTRFKNGVTAGHSIDGEIALSLKQRGTMSTRIDCDLGIRPTTTTGARPTRWHRLLAKLFVCDAAIEGLTMKGKT